jgi:chromosomal replication initiator protein
VSKARHIRLPDNVRGLLMRVSEETSVPGDDILGPKRYRSVARARQIVAWVARHRWNYSFPEIGAFLDRDHTSIMQACKQIEQQIERGTSTGRIALTLLRAEDEPPPRLRVP